MQHRRPADARPEPDELLRRDRAGRVLHRPPRARASTSPTTRCCRPGNFSYLDTQLTRLGGPNFDQLPINRPRSAGERPTSATAFGQQAIHQGVAAYSPTRSAAGARSRSGPRGFQHVPRTGDAAPSCVSGRSRSATTTRQATMFWNSMSAPSGTTSWAPSRSSSGKCVAPRGAGAHAGQPGQRRRGPLRAGRRQPRAAAPDGAPARTSSLHRRPRSRSPQARADRRAGGRRTGRPGVDASGVAAVRAPLRAAGAVLVVIAPGRRSSSADGPVEVTKARSPPSRWSTTRSWSRAALAPDAGPDPYLAVNLGEAYRHYKTIAAWGAGRDLLAACSIPADAPGVIIADIPKRGFATAPIEGIGWAPPLGPPAPPPSTSHGCGSRDPLINASVS